MTMEKNRKINELITEFLGHEPDEAERKEFRIMNQLGESIIYHHGELVGTVKYKTDEGPII
jgi:hypothetical protein